MEKKSCPEGYYWNTASKTCRKTGRTRKKEAEAKKKNNGKDFKGAYGGN